MTPMELRQLYGGMPADELSYELTKLEAELELLHHDERGALRDLTSEEQRSFDEKIAQRAYLDETIRAHAGIRRAYKPGRVASAYDGLDRGEGGYSFSGDARKVRGDEARDQALRVLNSDKRLAPDQLNRVERLIHDEESENREEAYVARRILLTERPEYRSAWRQLMTQPRPVLSAEEASAIREFERWDREETRGMTEGSGAAGGFGVPVFIDPSIVLTAQGSGNPFLDAGIARVAEITTNIWKGVSSAGVTWSFDAEASAVSDDSPTLAQPVVTVFMARGFLPYSIELGDDYPQFADEMAGLLAEGYDELLIDKFSRGSGAGEPQGILTALDANTNVEVLLTTAGNFGEVDFYNVWKAVPQRFRRRASWMMSVGVNNAIRRFGTANVFHAFSDTIVGAWADKLMNKAVYESPYFPDIVNTTGHFNQLVVGDFRNYVVARRSGMNVELVPTLFDVTNNRPTGQRGWFAYARIGGGSINDLAFRLLNQT